MHHVLIVVDIKTKVSCDPFRPLLLCSNCDFIARPNRVQFLCSIICMLSKYHYGLFQKLISVVLYAGHCGTVVSLGCWHADIFMLIIGLYQASKIIYMYEQKFHVLTL